MHISSLVETKNLWEGMLEAPAVTYRGVDSVSASIGEPFQWADGEMLGDKWKPPVGGNRFYLLQLAFTLSPRGNIKVTSADFCLTLNKQGDKHPRWSLTRFRRNKRWSRKTPSRWALAQT